MAWSARSATALAPPAVKEDLDVFKTRLTGLHGDIQERIASGVPAASWALIKAMLPEGAVVSKPEVEPFAGMVQELMRPQTKAQRDTLYARIQHFGRAHGYDTKKGRVDALRALLNRRDDRKQLLQRLRATLYEDLDEEDHDMFDNIDEYIAYESKTTPKALPWIVKLLGNPALALMAREVIQAELADLYAHTTERLQGDYYRSHDIRPFVQFAFQLHQYKEAAQKARKPTTETTTTYLSFLEDLYGDLSGRLDAAWGLLVAYFEAPGTHPNPRARTTWMKESILLSFSIYMGLTPEKEAAFKSLVKTYFLHSPTTMPSVYKVLIRVYNETYSASMRDFAFYILIRMVKLAETMLPKTSVHLRVFTIIQPFKGFFDEYYGTKYENGDEHGGHYTRNFMEILQLLKNTLRIDDKETDMTQRSLKKTLLDEKQTWFNKHYQAYLAVHRPRYGGRG